MTRARIANLGLCAAVLSATACYYDPPRGRDDVFGSDTSVDPTQQSIPIVANQDVDILFVIDNSYSMGEPQRRLARDAGKFIDALEATSANYRIGFTTTDAGNPRCPNTTPENGALVLKSCLDRADDGEFNAYVADENKDYSNVCSDHCSKRDADLTVHPTPTQYDPSPSPRRWIERYGDELNIEGLESNAEAFKCYAPQGLSGCGFESHLESMYESLDRSSAQGDNYGFIREAAVLAIVIVSDEIDCSYQQEDIFTTNKVFWNPDDPAPTSRLCWRAGVECAGNSPYSDCHAAKWGLNADKNAAVVDVPDAEAVLRPVGEYISFVAAIQAEKQTLDPDQQVLVSLITGVPPGYKDGSAELVYADANDEEVQDLFGIGPGCSFDDPTAGERGAVPPVREREFAEAFTDGSLAHNLYSICESTYANTLTSIAERIGSQLRPGCMPSCVLDLDPATPTADTDCKLYESLDGTNKVEIPPCVSKEGKWATPGPDAPTCFAQLVDVDSTQTPSALDDMSPACVDQGLNLEFKIVRTGPTSLGSRLTALCQLSDNKPRDCPML